MPHSSYLERHARIRDLGLAPASAQKLLYAAEMEQWAGDFLDTALDSETSDAARAQLVEQRGDAYERAWKALHGRYAGTVPLERFLIMLGANIALHRHREQRTHSKKRRAYSGSMLSDPRISNADKRTLVDEWPYGERGKQRSSRAFWESVHRLAHLSGLRPPNVGRLRNIVSALYRSPKQHARRSASRRGTPRKPLSSPQRAEIVAARARGVPVPTIARQVRCSKSAVYDVINRFYDAGELAPRGHGGGAPRKRDEKLESSVERLLKKEPALTSAQVAARARNADGARVTAPTIRRTVAWNAAQAGRRAAAD